MTFTNQVFLKIAFICEIGMHACVCMLASLLKTGDTMWTPKDWFNKFYSFYVAGK